MNIFIFLEDTNKVASYHIRNSWLQRTRHSHDELIIFNKNNYLKKLIYLLKLLLTKYCSLKNVYVSTNPKIFVLFFILFPFKKKILYLGDPFLSDVSQKNSLKNFLYHLIYLLYVNKVYVFSPFLKDYYKHKQSEFLQREARYRDMFSDNQSSNVFVVPGDCNSGRDLSVFLEWMPQNTTLTILGDAGENQDPRISVKGKVGGQKFIDEINSAKALILPLNPSGYQVPGKFYDFMDCGKKCYILDYNHHTDELDVPGNYEILHVKKPVE